jgi:hypothetical protein
VPLIALWGSGASQPLGYCLSSRATVATSIAGGSERFLSIKPVPCPDRQAVAKACECAPSRIEFQAACDPTGDHSTNGHELVANWLSILRFEALLPPDTANAMPSSGDALASTVDHPYPFQAAREGRAPFALRVPGH